VQKEIDVPMFNSAQRYGAVVQFMHWSTAVLVVVAWLLGEFHEMLPQGTARGTAIFLHISAGLLVLAILVLRALWRLADAPPEAEPTALGATLERIGRLAHYALYILLLAASVTGIVAQFARGRGVPLFGLAEIASPWAANRAFARQMTDVHELAANALVVLACVHAAAALAHHWIFRDRTLVRMLPGKSA
jgi:cytochrome b561